MRDDWRPQPEDDPCGRVRGQRDPFAYQQELQEFEEHLEEHGMGAWEARQTRWLTRMRENAT
jgi:hypothetical protein